jgi:hypothetical protein
MPLPRQEQLCRLAARLGYTAAWLTWDEPPHHGALETLDALVSAAGPARVGVVFGPAGPHLSWLAQYRNHPSRSRVLIEVDAHDLAGPLIAALGGEDAAARRVVVRGHHPLPATRIVRSPDRDQTADRLRRARQTAPPEQVLSVDVPVVFGRTLGEAEARLNRDPWLSAQRDPRRAGLFGTFSDAQNHVIDLVAAGARSLRALLADEADASDLLAQLRAVTVGPVLVPTTSRCTPAGGHT